MRKGYHTGSVLAMEDDMAGPSGSEGGAVAIDMGGAVQSYMQVSYICSFTGRKFISFIFIALECPLASKIRCFFSRYLH